MIRESPLFILILSISVSLAACGSQPSSKSIDRRSTSATRGEQPISVTTATPLLAATESSFGKQFLPGTKVTIFGAYTELGEKQAFEAGFKSFEKETGIDVVYEGASDFETLIATRIEGNDAPDIAGFPQPGLMKRFTDQAIDLSTVINMNTLQQQYNHSWIDMAKTPDGKIIGVWNRAVVKSLVWYAPKHFNAAGYTIPTTWDAMLALSDKMVADGKMPWYAPMEGGHATGWVGTDWIEDIMLRTTSLENYDRWTVPSNPNERLLFTSPEVKNAFEKMGHILRNEDYVYGGILSTLQDRFFDTGKALLEGNAYLAKQGSYMPAWLADDYPHLRIGTEGDLNYFLLPEIDAQYGNPVLVGGDVYSMYNDRPEVRAVITYLTKARSIQPGIKEGIFLSPHQDVDLDWFDEANRGIAEILLNASAVRFDGSDLQPGQVGTNTFWSGIVDYISGEDLDSILASIDTSWPE